MRRPDGDPRGTTAPPDNPWRLKIDLRRRPRVLPLRFRFAIQTALVLLLLLGALSWGLSLLQSRTIRSQIETRGLALAHNLAAASMSALLTYNYVAIEQLVNRAVGDPALTRVVIHDKEGRVAGYSGRPDLTGRVLDDPLSRGAVLTRRATVATVALPGMGEPVLDVTLPVVPPDLGERWGTVRVTLSLAAMRQQIRQTRLIVWLVGAGALCIGVLVSVLMARRITRPLGTLTHASLRAARGDLDPAIRVATGDEVEILADTFAAMIREVLAHRAKLEQQLSEIRQLQRYTHKLLTSMPDGLLSLNMRGEVVTINPAAQRLLDVAARSAAGRRLAELLNGSSPLAEYLLSVLAYPRDGGQREVALGAAAEPLRLLVGTSVLRDEAGLPAELIVNLHDVTALKRLEARVRQKERLAALGTLAAGMSHEIRNPLSAIKTFVQLLPRKANQRRFMEKFNRTVPREINRINQLVEDLLDLAREPRYELAPIDVRDVVVQVLELMEPDLQSAAVTLETHLADDLPAVMADADQLAKAFHNLGVNALQAMPDGGRLTVRVERCADAGEAAAVCVCFADTGCGMAPEAQERIFNPFFTTKDTGTGLGLAITHKVISEHAGRIEVVSREGRGTRFSITFPA